MEALLFRALPSASPAPVAVTIREMRRRLSCGGAAVSRAACLSEGLSASQLLPSQLALLGDVSRPAFPLHRWRSVRSALACTAGDNSTMAELATQQLVKQQWQPQSVAATVVAATASSSSIIGVRVWPNGVFFLCVLGLGSGHASVFPPPGVLKHSAPSQGKPHTRNQ